MAHRIREPMRHDGLGGMFTGRVIADETYIGGKPSNRHRHQPGQGGQSRTDKTPILSLVSRETGEVRSTVIPDVTGRRCGRPSLSRSTWRQPISTRTPRSHTFR